MQDFNICAFGTDSYKVSHHNLYPPGTEQVYSYCEPRVGGRFKEVVFFGLQYIVQRYLAGQVVTQEKIDEAAATAEAHFGSAEVFNREGWEYILNAHNGMLPIRIEALPEGTVVPEGTCLFTIENTDPRVPWLTNYLETLLMQVWSPTTVATGSREVKKIISRWLEKTGCPQDGLPFKLHDFGYRGVSSMETAALAGAAHLVNFMGTDTMASLSLLRDYYDEPMAGFSIPATEHSIMTARGPEGEADIVRQVLDTHPTGLVAMVIDSFDTIGFIKRVVGQNYDIKQRILNREGTVVFRPDSGELPQVDLDVFNALARVFGTENNAAGFAMLPDQVRMIQGDGIKWLGEDEHGFPRHTVDDILYAFARERIAADNIAFGSGGGLLQDWTRDTQRFAIKCSAMMQDGEYREIFKRPATDPTKNSKRGRLAVVNSDNPANPGIITISEDRVEFYAEGNMLQSYFVNGRISPYHKNSLAEIRERAALEQLQES
jgi:nicotinamide phosphoribosyltransferase